MSDFRTRFKEDFDEAFAPISRLLAHSCATLVGFIILCIISKIPFLAMHLLVKLHLAEEKDALHYVESAILYVDLFLFILVLAVGLIVFIKEEGIRLWKRFFGETKS